MRAFFFGSVLIASVAFLPAQRASGAEHIRMMMREEARKAKEATETFHFWFLPRPGAPTIHPIWRPNKLDDDWGQGILDIFLTQSAARSPFAPSPRVMIVGFADDDSVEDLAKERPRIMSGGSLTMPDREENRVLKKLKILVRGMPDKTPDVDVAGLQKNVCMNDASRAATAALDDLRYGFICTPIGDPLAKLRLRFSRESNSATASTLPVRFCDSHDGGRGSPMPNYRVETRPPSASLKAGQL